MRRTCAVCLTTLLSAGWLQQARADTEHEWQLSARARVAHAETAGETGRAASLLARAQLESQWTDKVSSLVELDHVATFWDDQHSDGIRSNGEPLIPDVSGTELNQLIVEATFDRFRVSLGRQRIELDDRRFVGSNDFWQNDQTFDALAAAWKLWSMSRLHYAYIANANRIFGDDADGDSLQRETHYYGDQAAYGPFLGDHEQRTHLFHLQVNEWDYARVIAYAYFIDNLDHPAVSNNTLGGKYKFTGTTDTFKYEGALALAVQERTKLPDSPRPAYGLADFSVIRGAWRGLVRYELLGSDSGAAFVTPLSSAHNFHGWADLFSEAPSQGLEDTSVGINWRSSPWEIHTRYHLFREHSGSDTYGREFDIDVIYKPARNHSIMLRYGDFHVSSGYADSLSDQRRIYLDYSYNF